MTEPFVAISRLLTDVILPNLKSVQSSQAEQIAANDRLENAIEDLRVRLEAQFAHLAAQLTACRAEVAAAQATFKAAQAQDATMLQGRTTLIH
jgi:hypothetical protein